ncbi:hypothetical protein LINPERHAP1_LOCUS7063, partial [Linum perenne]
MFECLFSYLWYFFTKWRDISYQLEDLRLRASSSRHEMVINKSHDVVANITEHRFLHDALFSPITSLKPSENKFRSLTVSFPPYLTTTFFMASTISIIRTCFSKRNSQQHSTLLIPIYNLENKNSSRAKR